MCEPYSYLMPVDPGAMRCEDGHGGQNLIHLAVLTKGRDVDFERVIKKIESKFSRYNIIEVPTTCPTSRVLFMRNSITSTSRISVCKSKTTINFTTLCIP